MRHVIDVQYALDGFGLPGEELLTRWAGAALESADTAVEVTIRVVDEDEGAQLNRQWRNGHGATNVLSFPVAADLDILPRLLGDIVICAPLLAREAGEQGKQLEAHWAHMVIHGVLHLLGYDHTQAQQADTMEALEIAILAGLEIDNPYN